MNVNGLKRITRCLPVIVCMTVNDKTASAHARGKTRSQQKANNRNGHHFRLGLNCPPRQEQMPVKLRR